MEGNIKIKLMDIYSKLDDIDIPTKKKWNWRIKKSIKELIDEIEEFETERFEKKNQRGWNVEAYFAGL